MVGRSRAVALALSLALCQLLHAGAALAQEPTAVSGQGAPSDAAYAVLTEEGELVFLRSEEAPGEGPGRQVTDVAGATWSGEVYGGVEDAAYARPDDVPWRERADEVAAFRVAPGSVVRPASCAWLLSGLSSMESCNLEGLDTSATRSMRGMFYGCGALAELDASPLDTSSATDMAGMFARCRSLGSLDLTGFDVSGVTTMGSLTREEVGATSLGMFACCHALASLDIAGWDTSSVTDMSAMFCQCMALDPLPLDDLDTRAVADMSGMFSVNYFRTELDLSCLDTSSLREARGMLNGMTALRRLDLFSFDTTRVRDMGAFFGATPRLREVRLGEGFSFRGESADESGWCRLPDPPATEPHDGTWCRGWDVATALTATELRDSWDGTGMAGTWVWTERGEHAVSYDLAGGTAADLDAWPRAFVTGTALPLPGCAGSALAAPTRHGHAFAGWAGADGAAMSEVPATAHEDVAVTATWEPLQVRVTVPVAIDLVATPAGDGGLSLAAADPDFTHRLSNEGQVPVTVRARAEAAGGIALVDGGEPSEGEAAMWMRPQATGGGQATDALALSPEARELGLVLEPGGGVWLNGLGGRMAGWPGGDGGRAPLLTIHWTFGLAPEE